MMTLIRDGGFPMFILLALGAGMLVTSFAYAVRPSAQSERFIHWLCISVLASVAASVSADFAVTLHAATSSEMPLAERVQIAMEGGAESLAPAILGFAMLSLTALMLAVGKRRLDAKRTA